MSSMKINYNVSAMVANNSLKINDNKLTASLERLSSGYKINSAKDDAAGLAIARRMHAQIRGLDTATQDAKDGVSIVEIADGALAEVQDMLQRMNELAVKSANGTMSEDDRSVLNNEVDQLKEEITRIGQTTEFNSQKLFDGSFDLKGYTDDNSIKVNYYSDETEYGEYTLDFKLQKDADGNLVKEIVKLVNPKGTEISADTIDITVDDKQVIITAEDGLEIRLGFATELTENTDESVKINLTGIGAMTLQIGANEGQTIDIRIPELSLLNAGIDDLDLSTYDGAMKGIGQIDEALKYVSEMRSRLGAYQNRLEHTQSNLTASSENVTAAYSRIMDTDMATEMTEYTNLQVVSQAATSILAQANERPSQMLQLLQ